MKAIILKYLKKIYFIWKKKFKKVCNTNLTFLNINTTIKFKII
jgi:hypothetical protein